MGLITFEIPMYFSIYKTSLVIIRLTPGCIVTPGGFYLLIICWQFGVIPSFSSSKYLDEFSVFPGTLNYAKVYAVKRQIHNSSENVVLVYESGIGRLFLN